MDIRQLTYFLAIVDHGGFGRAAEHLHVAQPSLSQAMAGLERELGVGLFHRVGRGVTLTDPGAQLIGPARQVLRDLEAARDTVQSARGLRRGRIDIVSMPSPGIEPLTTMMATFADLYPAMTVNVEGAFTPQEVVQSVRSGVAEIGILGSAGSLHTADLRVLPIEDQPLMLISPPDTGLPTGDTVDRRELDGRRLIVSQPGSLMRQLVDDVLASGLNVHLVAEIAHRTSILPLVMAGLGHAVMPSSWGPIATRVGAVVRRIEPASFLRIAMVSRTSDPTPGARAFLQIAAQYADAQRRDAEPPGASHR